MTKKKLLSLIEHAPDEAEIMVNIEPIKSDDRCVAEVDIEFYDESDAYYIVIKGD
jgi:hypothetical protein